MHTAGGCPPQRLVTRLFCRRSGAERFRHRVLAGWGRASEGSPGRARQRNWRPRAALAEQGTSSLDRELLTRSMGSVRSRRRLHD
jgi:hypothetical protein